MLSRRVGSRETPVTVHMMIIRRSLGCLPNDMMVRLIVLVQLHLHHRQTPLYLLYLSR